MKSRSSVERYVTTQDLSILWVQTDENLCRGPRVKPCLDPDPTETEIINI